MAIQELFWEQPKQNKKPIKEESWKANKRRGSGEIPIVGSGPSYLSLSRFKPLGFREKKLSF